MKSKIHENQKNNYSRLSKKSIVYLGMALITFTAPAMASNSVAQHQNLIPLYGKSTPLCIAIQKGEFDLVKKLVAYGADVNEKSNGMTPLMVAARYNKVEIIKFLLAKGAALDIKDEKGFTALKYAELSSANEVITILKQA